MFFAHTNTLCCWLLAGLVLPVVAAIDAHATDSHTPDAQATSAKISVEEARQKYKVTARETILYVGDLHCKACAKKVAGKLYAVAGVKRVRTDVKDDVAIITPQQKKQLDVPAIWKAAQAAGFPPLQLVGPQGTFVADPQTQAAVREQDAQPAATSPG